MAFPFAGQWLKRRLANAVLRRADAQRTLMSIMAGNKRWTETTLRQQWSDQKAAQSKSKDKDKNKLGEAREKLYAIMVQLHKLEANR